MTDELYKKRILNRLQAVAQAGQLNEEILDFNLEQLRLCNDENLKLKIETYWDIQQNLKKEYDEKIILFNKNIETLLKELLKP